MIFDRLPLDEAVGAFLAHAVDAGEFGLLKKGTLLNELHLDALKAEGVENVLAARLEPEDIPENEAAFAIAEPAAGDQAEARSPFTGRSNIFATASGLVVLNRDLLKRLNKIDPSITIATVRHLETVQAGNMLATIKIIPFATKQTNLDQASALFQSEAEPLLTVRPFRQRKIGLISTRLPNTPDKLVRKSVRVLTERLEACGNTLAFELECEHHEDNLKTVIEQLKANECDLILIFGASAITDERDIIPTAICNAGGTVAHFGMPVDPGNLLLMANIDQTTVIGMPGCTRSPKLNGFDWVLQRLLADIPVTADDIMEMGEGGLLKEIPGRPQPRNKKMPDKSKSNPKITAILLAAGQSRRMGSDNKLLALLDGKPMLRHVAETLKSSSVEDISLVTGHEAEMVKNVVWDMGFQVIENPDYAEGLSTSVKVGFQAVQDKYDGVLICLGDMPFISATEIDQMISAFDPLEGRAIITPTFKGKRGNPVLISTQFADDIAKISGDMGAKALIAENDHLVHSVEFDSPAIFTDIDTPEMLKAASGHSRGNE